MNIQLVTFWNILPMMKTIDFVSLNEQWHRKQIINPEGMTRL